MVICEPAISVAIFTILFPAETDTSVNNFAAIFGAFAVAFSLIVLKKSATKKPEIVA
ncbi:hypothetical protein SDC9_188496 [bioreactor metagenome]|uniref:Uncharacterized protein n=1 Tax=bioreactor metagenome TaxID=1076179 RepID=A0A645HQW7_9ZZZZ